MCVRRASRRSRASSIRRNTGRRKFGQRARRFQSRPRLQKVITGLLPGHIKDPPPHYGSAASSFVCSFRPHVRLSLEGKGHKNSPKLTGRLFMQRVTKIPIRRSKGQRSRLPGLLHYSDTFGCGKATVRGTSSYIQQLFRTIYKMHRAWQSVTTCSRKNTINSI